MQRGSWTGRGRPPIRCPLRRPSHLEGTSIPPESGRPDGLAVRPWDAARRVALTEGQTEGRVQPSCRRATFSTHPQRAASDGRIPHRQEHQGFPTHQPTAARVRDSPGEHRGSWAFRTGPETGGRGYFRGVASLSVPGWGDAPRAWGRQARIMRLRCARRSIGESLRWPLLEHGMLVDTEMRRCGC